jgi:translation initiation factor 4E
MSSLIANHKLQSSWSLYYHSPTDNNWGISSYTKVYSITSIESFWTLFRKISDLQIGSGMFFIMRNEIKPVWEDEQNKKGGCWSYKVSKKDSYKGWIELAVSLIGENITEKPLFINGISISPKKGFCVIKIWNNDNKFTDKNLLNKNISYLNTETTIYKAFS